MSILELAISERIKALQSKLARLSSGTMKIITQGKILGLKEALVLVKLNTD